MADVDGAIDLREVRDDPFLGPFARPFKDLLGTRKDRAGVFRAVAEALHDVRDNGVIQVTLRSGRKREHWCLALTPSGCELSEGHSEKADLEILTDADTWTQVVRGELSPLDAFVAGKARVLGNIGLARATVARLH